MGRRSINTTKSGKYMNPTDQARKEARKRELKKNKKQRQMVRSAVLKGKDPIQLITDMDKIDEMEFNVISPPILNEKVLKDKRKKLKETWDRVMRLYHKEDRERYNELKKLELEYEARRSILMRYFESVRIAQQVQVDEIPLPSTPHMAVLMPSQIPLPNEIENFAESINMALPPHSILKKSAFGEKEAGKLHLKAPGVPPGPIPDLSSDEEDEVSKVLREISKQDPKSAKNKKIRFADEKVGSDEENDDLSQKKSKTKDSVDLFLRSFTDKHKLEDIPVPPMPQPASLPPGPPKLPEGPPPNVSSMYRPPPPIRSHIPPLPRMMPPGVPPRPTLPPPGMPIRVGAPPIRLPPGPPPGMPPPRLLRPPSIPPSRISSSIGTTAPSNAAGDSGLGNIAVLSAPPSLMQRPKIAGLEDESQRSATIEAKPQIRNLSADVMRFMPTTLRVKREDRFKKGSTSKTGSTYEHARESYSSATLMTNPSAPTKDDAYLQFLKEMKEFL